MKISTVYSMVEIAANQVRSRMSPWLEVGKRQLLKTDKLPLIRPHTDLELRVWIVIFHQFQEQGTWIMKPKVKEHREGLEIKFQLKTCLYNLSIKIMKRMMTLWMKSNKIKAKEQTHSKNLFHNIRHPKNQG